MHSLYIELYLSNFSAFRGISSPLFFNGLPLFLNELSFVAFELLEQIAFVALMNVGGGGIRFYNKIFRVSVLLFMTDFYINLP